MPRPLNPNRGSLVNRGQGSVQYGRDTARSVNANAVLSNTDVLVRVTMDVDDLELELPPISSVDDLHTITIIRVPEASLDQAERVLLVNKSPIDPAGAILGSFDQVAVGYRETMTVQKQGRVWVVLDGAVPQSGTDPTEAALCQRSLVMRIEITAELSILCDGTLQDVSGDPEWDKQSIQPSFLDFNIDDGQTEILKPGSGAYLLTATWAVQLDGPTDPQGASLHITRNGASIARTSIVGDVGGIVNATITHALGLTDGDTFGLAVTGANGDTVTLQEGTSLTLTRLV